MGSYPTVSPLPDPLRAVGGLFSVALSVTPEGVPRRYLAACPAEPGLSSVGSRPSRPSGRSPRTKYISLGIALLVGSLWGHRGVASDVGALTGRAPRLTARTGAHVGRTLPALTLA